MGFWQRQCRDVRHLKRQDAFYLRLFYVKLLIYSFLQYIFGWRSGRTGSCFRNIAMWLQHVIGLCNSGCWNLHMSIRESLIFPVNWFHLNIFVQFKSAPSAPLFIGGRLQLSTQCYIILYYTLLFSDWCNRDFMLTAWRNWPSVH